MRNTLLIVVAAMLIGCSNNSASGSPMPAPVLQHCTARIADSAGRHATLAISFASSTASAPAVAPAGALTLTPSSITLDAQHGSTRVAVADIAGYTGHYAITFIDCAGYLDVRWPNRSTLIITL
jgi:hypothetical protein